jgi:hydroxymethylpyrimidine pyrophosphatase-like HAD family hydrolase
MLRAVIMDGDGSTINEDNSMPANLGSLILQMPHIKWIMATGRSFDLLQRLPILNYLANDVPHIVDGGSTLIYKTGVIHSRKRLSVQDINHLFDNLVLSQVEFIYFAIDDEHKYLYVPQHQLSTAISYRPQFASAISISDLATYKQLTLHYQPPKIFLRINQNSVILPQLHWQQNERNIDITPANADKGTACYELLQLLNIQPVEMVFVFNDNNDLPLIRHPELQHITSIKVGNLLPHIEADYLASSPYDVAATLEKILLK